MKALIEWSPSGPRFRCLECGVILSGGIHELTHPTVVGVMKEPSRCPHRGKKFERPLHVIEISEAK